MESFLAYLSFVDEINHGMEDVKQLRESCSPDQEALVDKMLASYKDAVSTLDCSDTSLTGAFSKDFEANLDGNVAQSRLGKYKRSRDFLNIKCLVDSEPGNRVPDDGCAWKKYGQKEILGSKYPRSYYRCVHRFDEGCKATKQIQRSDTKPSKYKVTYHGDHTCVGKEYIIFVPTDSMNEAVD